MANLEWIQTYTGRAFPLFAPTSNDVVFDDIAHSLSNLCRFAGHTREFYSVAQHSVLVSYHVPAEHALQALLHDAPEAYLVDIPRPLKRSPALSGYGAIEDRVWQAIAEHFYLFPDFDPSIKVADNRALFTEQRDLMARAPKPWKDPYPPFPDEITPLGPREAKLHFNQRYEELVFARSAMVREAFAGAA